MLHLSLMILCFGSQQQWQQWKSVIHICVFRVYVIYDIFQHYLHFSNFRPLNKSALHTAVESSQWGDAP